MIKNLFAVFVFIISSFFCFQIVSAQITITIPQVPKIPKIKKNKPTQPELPITTDDSRSNDNRTNDRQTNDEQTSDNNSSGTEDKCENSVWLKSHVEDINKRREEVESYTPERGWLVSTSQYDHLLFAVSPSAKQDWLTNSNALDFKNCPTLVAAFDKLAAAAAKKLPSVMPDKQDYAVHNLTEEKLMKSKITNFDAHKIFYIGITEPNWLIEKNEFGIPKARYKHGMVWVRNTKDDHPYCRVYYINIVSEYAGGGTYGASYGNYVGQALVGCPAEK